MKIVVVKAKKRSNGDPAYVLYAFDTEEEAINFIDDCSRMEGIEVKNNVVETDEEIISLM